MMHMRKVLLACAVVLLTAGPAIALPTLSAHAPTLDAPSAPSSHAPDPRTLPLMLGPSCGIVVKKDAGSIASKWSQRAGAASQDYATGVQGAGSAWQQNTAAAEQAYQDGVTQAIAKKRFGAGVTANAASRFVRKATTDGPQRFASGVQGSTDSYTAGVQPYLDVLKGVNLPPRGPKGSPANMQRAQVVAMALRAKKVGS